MTKLQVPRGVLWPWAALCGAVLVAVAWYDIVQVNSWVRHYAARTGAFHSSLRYAINSTEAGLQWETPFKFAHDPHFRDVPAVASTNTTDDDDGDAFTCRVQFVFAGPKYNYKKFPLLQSWLHYAAPRCAIDFIRPRHDFHKLLTLDEQAMLNDTAYLPILQADFMKLLVIYYLGGLVVDLDIEARAPFPDSWTGPDTALATCDVVLGVETDCYDDECAKTMVRKGQLQNWAMWTRRPRSPFLGLLLEYVVAKYKTLEPHNMHITVQEVSGSGTITDFVNLYGGLDRPHYQVTTTTMGHSLETDRSSVLRIVRYGEEVCVTGSHWTGGGCVGERECLIGHQFESSWRAPPT
ncbi:Aste57867_12686 [Aphanomyces stellatus]|uniref:Aste57867_12686 protein n=1 Tax=Aphanomyces stellatus TaxID=120398 RepID=A0A485KWV8_9STRA|nr:hypothetical protein As57867_012639 [Aphanomyces stellatus]VFT89536.1 Aste57867_12686 [Aphanomyces stellatus]